MSKKQSLLIAFSFVCGLSPLTAFAQTSGLQGVLYSLASLVSLATPIIVAFALVAFFWGLARYLMNFSGDDKDKKKGRDIMISGILVLFVMVSIWGIVQILQNTFFSQEGPARSTGIPCLPLPGVTDCDNGVYRGASNPRSSGGMPNFGAPNYNQGGYSPRI